MLMNKDYLLMSLLNCGSYDLALLEKIDIEFADILENLKACGIEINLNSILWSSFDIGLNETNNDIGENKEPVIEEIEEKIENMKNEIAELENNKNEIEKLNDKILELYKDIENIKQLDIFEDTEYYINYIDTSIWFANNKEIYTKYFKTQLENFKDMTGFSID